MNEVVFRVIAIFGLLTVVLGNYFSLKTKTREKFTYLLFVFGAACLLLYSVSIHDIIFTVLQAVVIVTSSIEYYIVHIKKIRSPKLKNNKLKP